MKKYKLNRKLVTIKCDTCNCEFEKPVSEYNRNLKLGRNNYCSRSCCGKSTTNLLKLQSIDRSNSNHDISQYSNNRKDEYYGFRYYYRNSKNRFKEFDLTLQDLKEQWDVQEGKCPYTNISLNLFNPKIKYPYETRASLDRIDNSKGYIKGNIEFISLPINYLKSDQFTKQQVFDFLANITSNFH